MLNLTKSTIILKVDKNDYEINEKNILPTGFSKLLYLNQRGWINVFFRSIYLGILKKIFNKKIIKFKTIYNTNYNCFHWDHSSSSVFYSNGNLEWGIEYFFIQTLKNRQRNIFLDVGCHSGYFSCLYNSHFKKIIGFEPSSKCVEPLELLKKEYKNFTYFNYFLGNCNKTVVSKQYEHGWAFIKENTKDIQSLELQAISSQKGKVIDEKNIEVKTIDEIMLNNYDSQNISGIKIDVDGIDLEVLKGGLQIIERDRPSIMIENDSMELRSLMRKINYRTFTLAANVNKPYNVCLKELTNNDNKFWNTNSVCVPKEHVPKDLYTKEIKGNFLFGINRKIMFEKFS